MENDEQLTSAEAARLLGVSPSSVKRWADTGLLECLKTAGRHRRFERAVVERFRGGFAESGGATAPTGSDDSWLDVLIDPPTPLALEARLERARERLGAWWQVADAIAPLLVEIGERWRAGQLDILGEHELSERLSRAFARVAGSIRVAERAPLAVLAVAEGENHTLGLSLLEVCLREAGFRIRWGGRETPTSEVLAAVEARSVALVAVSASEAYADAARLAEQARALNAACAAAGIDLLLGGRGPWPPGLAHARRLWTFAELYRSFTVKRAQSTRGPSAEGGGHR